MHTYICIYIYILHITQRWQNCLSIDMEIHGVCVCIWKTTLKQKSSRIEMSFPPRLGNSGGQLPIVLSQAPGRPSCIPTSTNCTARRRRIRWQLWLACWHVGDDDDDDDDDDVCLSDNDGIDGNDAPQLSKDEPTRDPLDTTDFEQLALNVSFFFSPRKGTTGFTYKISQRCWIFIRVDYGVINGVLWGSSGLISKMDWNTTSNG